MRRGGMELRWYFVLMVTVAIAISYFDRQTLPVAISAIQRNIPISNEQFSYLQTAFLLAYATMYRCGRAASGPAGDAAWVSGDHGVVVGGLRAAWICGGVWVAAGGAVFCWGWVKGEGFPAAVRVVSEWIPAEERSTAVGIINAGTAVGSVLAAPLVARVILTLGWRWVFFLSGGLGMMWVVWWWASYRGGGSGGVGRIRWMRECWRGNSPLLRWWE